MNYGIQLYSLRDLMEKDFRSGLKEVADLGYRAVEFAGYFSNEEKIPNWMRELELKAWGTHTGLALLEEHYEAQVALHHQLDCSLVIVPWLKANTLSEAHGLCDRLEQMKQRLEKDGLRLAYHNHDHEFFSLENGASFEELLLQETSVDLELDTYWVYAAGEDPIVWMKKVHSLGRLPVIHLKDGFSNGEGVPLGKGTAPVSRIHDFCKENGIPMVVESETLTPSGPEEAKVCMEYLRTMK